MTGPQVARVTDTFEQQSLLEIFGGFHDTPPFNSSQVPDPAPGMTWPKNLTLLPVGDHVISSSVENF